MKKKYSWKYAGFKAEAQKVGEELEKIEELETLSNKSVLTYARENKNSELYKCFEWDNGIAGEKYRLIQASNIISSISFVVNEKPVEKQKIYYSVKTEEKNVNTFKNIKGILNDDNEYEKLCNKAKKEIENCTEKYNTLIQRNDLKNIIFEIYKEV